ncbi:MAG: hypothetical protein ABIQ74_14395 [Chitinophagales bacterium]
MIGEDPVMGWKIEIKLNAPIGIYFIEIKCWNSFFRKKIIILD